MGFQNGTKFGSLIGPCCTPVPRLVNFGSGVPLGRQNIEGCKKFVTLFSAYIVWPSTMKFGTVRGIYLKFISSDSE